MNILVCIDDTDDLDSPGTGELAAEIAQMIEVRNWGRASFITRHQLLVHPDIPYTSHNSAMCFAADIGFEHLEPLIENAGEFLAKQSAPGSDPGLCIAAPVQLSDPSALLSFGHEAKRSVLTKDDAYALARHLDIHLSEHGGTGQGVIGALAGAGLRMSGNDGRMRGSLGLPGDTEWLSAGALLGLPHVDAVQSLDGVTLPDEARVQLGSKVKTVMQGGRSVLLVKQVNGTNDEVWRTCNNQELRCY